MFEVCTGTPIRSTHFINADGVYPIIFSAMDFGDDQCQSAMRKDSKGVLKSS